MEKQEEDKSQSSDKLEELRKLIEGCQFGLDKPVQELGSLRQKFMELKFEIDGVLKGKTEDNPTNSKEQANALAREMAKVIPEIQSQMTAVSDRLNNHLSGRD